MYRHKKRTTGSGVHALRAMPTTFAGLTRPAVYSLVLLSASILCMMPVVANADAGVIRLGSSVAGLVPGQGVSAEGPPITVPLNKSRIVNLDKPATRVSVANPEIADILVLNARELYVVGKQLGTTNVVVWDRKKRVQRILGVEVTHDLSALKEKLHRYLPGERIGVESAQDTIVLSGEVSSTQKMDAALGLARTFVAGPRIRQMKKSGPRRC